MFTNVMINETKSENTTPLTGKDLSLLKRTSITTMEKVIDKELISHLLLLEKDQQDKVLAYIKEMLVSDEMNRRAELSEKAIATGQVKSFDQFNADFERWKTQKTTSTK